MGVSLAKGGNVSLSKEAPGLSAVLVGLGWDVRTTTGADFDASALLLNESGKVVSDQHFVFYNNLKSPDGSVEHTGDNLTGEGEGDDESVKVNLAAVPMDVTRIVFPVSIHDAENRGQSFGQVRNAFIRVANQFTAPNSPVTTCPRMPRRRPRWSSVSCIATARSGSSVPWVRVTHRGFPGSPPTSASMSDNGQRP